MIGGPEHDPGDELLPKPRLELPQPTELVGLVGRGCLDLESDHAAIVRLRDEIDLQPRPIAEVVEAERGAAPGLLLEQLGTGEGLEQALSRAPDDAGAHR